MGIKLNVGASPIWRNKEWFVLDHKIKENRERFVKGDAANINLENNSCSLIFCSHMIEHLPHYKIQKVLLEFSRVLEIGGTVRILIPDLRKLAKAYVEDDKEFYKEILNENEGLREDLGLGGMFMNLMVSPGQDTILLNRDMTKFIGGYAHLYAYDFEMMKILLSSCGFEPIEQKRFCESSIPDFNEPLHVEGLKKEWQIFNKEFYKKNNLTHEYKNGSYNINFTITGFDKNPVLSLIVEAKKVKNVRPEDVVDMNSKEALNYNHYGASLLYDEEIRKKLALLKDQA